MNIVIDARMVGQEMHGIARYTYNLIKGVLNIDQKNKYIVLIGKDFPNIKTGNFERRILRSRWISISEQWELVNVLKELKPDLYHAPSFVAPVLNPFPMVMTIHDVNHIALADNYSLFHTLYYRFIVGPSAKKSSKILTDSEFSKKEISKYLLLPDEKIRVIYSGCGEEFRPIKDQKELERLRKRYSLPETLILYVGSYKPHKNVSNLLNAYARLSLEIPLVLSGKGNKDLLALSKALKVDKKIIFIGDIKESDLPAIYNCATLFVFPSFYEGFGLPPLEAMSCGCPVICSNTSSLPEVVGDAAIMVNPHDTKELAAAIHKILSDEGFRQEMIRRGLKRAAMYSWEETARRTLQVYEEVLRQ